MSRCVTKKEFKAMVAEHSRNPIFDELQARSHGQEGPTIRRGGRLTAEQLECNHESDGEGTCLGCGAQI